jgi:glycosyltransferase involved in cell wall biosynthesis
MSRLKIAVYTIALNEEKFVERWFNSCHEADYILIADTGSTDRTVEIAKKLGINVVNVSVVPFRFDDARNTSLSLLPADIDLCIALDLDEVLTDGWYQELQKVSSGVTRVEYRDVRLWKADGTPDVSFIASKVHARSGFRWIYPVHEMITQYVGKDVVESSDMEVHHYPDESKSRSSYLPLLEVAHKESPDNSQLHFWLAREYMNYGKNEEAAATFIDYLECFPDAWGPERAFANIYLGKLKKDRGLEYLLKAAEIAPYLRDPWLEIADFHHFARDWAKCLEAARRAEAITFKPEIYLLVESNWFGPKCFDLIALASHFLKDNVTAVEYGQKALELSPDDNRLQNNLSIYKKSLADDLKLLEKARNTEVVETKVEEVDYSNFPSVLWAIIAKDAENLLPLYLECILEQSYPKEKIFLHIRTNDNTDNTETVLHNFIESHGQLFMGISFSHESISQDLQGFELHEWDETRFRIMARLRQESVDFARANDFDFYFCADVDNFIVKDTLESLVALKLPVVAPFLRTVIPTHREAHGSENENYSNFHDGIDVEGGFVDTERYYQIMGSEVSGVLEVPLVHCTYLVSREIFEHINYGLLEGNWEYRNFALSCLSNSVKQYLDASRTFGFITFGNEVQDRKNVEEALKKLANK